MAWWRRMTNLLRRSRLDREIAEELQAHIEMRVEENVARGMTPQEARREARVRFGNAARMKESVTEADVSLRIEAFARDLRYAARRLRRSPVFTITAVVIIALGIGANAAVFDVLSAALLRPLPFPSAHRIVRITSAKDGVDAGMSPPDVRDIEARNHSFTYLAVYDQWRKNVVTTQPSDVPQQQIVGLAPAELFQSLGVAPVRGRLFSAEEGLRGRNHVALITEDFRRTHYPGKSNALDQKLIINGIVYQIVGVLPDTIPGWMSGGKHLEIWEPFLPEPGIWDESSRAGRGYHVVGLLKPGVLLEQAQADLRSIAANLGQTYPVDRGYDVKVEPLINGRAGNLKPLILLLFGAVLLILMIACSNLAGLLLARNSARAREFSMRAALGAPRTALIRQTLAEVFLLCVAGGAAGIGAARLAEGGLRQRSLAIPQLTDLHPDWRVVAFALGLTALTCVGFGLAPALLSSRTSPCEALKEGGRTAGLSAGHWLRETVVIAQIALSLMLVVASALLVQSIVRLQNQELGFRSDHLFKAHFYLPPVRYGTPEAITRFCDELQKRVQALPGVTDASVTTIFPPNDRWRMQFSIEGRPVSRLEDVPSALFGVTDRNYLRALQIPLLRGRDFAETDGSSTVPVAIVNEAFAEKYLGGEGAIGAHLALGRPDNLNVADEWMGNRNVRVEVIGVMGNVKNAGLAFAPSPQLITLYRQMPWVNFGFKDIAVRSQFAPERIENGVREQLQSLDRSLPLSEAASMAAYLADQSWDKSATATLLGVFAALGLTLALVGIYGVVSFLAVQRTREIGIRVALGASRRRILWMIVRQGALLAASGAVIGLAGSALTRRSISGLLYGIQALDARTLLFAAAGMIAVAVLAAVAPAWRAANVDPVRALHWE